VVLGRVIDTHCHDKRRRDQIPGRDYNGEKWKWQVIRFIFSSNHRVLVFMWILPRAYDQSLFLTHSVVSENFGNLGILKDLTDAIHCKMKEAIAYRRRFSWSRISRRRQITIICFVLRALLSICDIMVTEKPSLASHEKIEIWKCSFSDK
jgi:hypothetical protein